MISIGLSSLHFLYFRVLLRWLRFNSHRYASCILRFCQLIQRYRTLWYTSHFHVPLVNSMPQNLMIHILFPCSASQAIATEPLNSRPISMFRLPSHRYRTFKMYVPSPCSASQLTATEPLKCTSHLYVFLAKPPLEYKSKRSTKCAPHFGDRYGIRTHTLCAENAAS